MWLNGSSRDTVLQSLARFARYAGVSGVMNPTSSKAQHAPDMEAEAHAVLRRLGLARNRRQLMIFDNVDRDVQSTEDDIQASDVSSFLPWKDTVS